MTTGSGVEPVAIRIHAASRLLEIEWRGGARSTLSHAQLRRGCRCSSCEQTRRQGKEPDAADDVTLLNVTPYGGYALQFHFSDGHQRGIYPFAYLLELDKMTLAATESFSRS